MGYVWLLMTSTLSLTLCSAINVSLSFSMGTDITSIVSSPIGQPMAAVSGIDVAADAVQLTDACFSDLFQ